MKRAPVADNGLAARLARRDTLLLAFGQLLQETNSLWTRVGSQVGIATHSQVPDGLTLNKECTFCLAEFRRLSEGIRKLRSPIEQRIFELKQRGPGCLPAPVPASSLQTIVILHMVSNQAMGKRLDEINEVDKRRKDLLQQFEAGFKACQERFEEMAARLNLLIYMRDCVDQDGALPCNIMYATNIPQVVLSPFALGSQHPQLRGFEKEQDDRLQAAISAGHDDPERVKQELERRKKLLLQLRDQGARQL